MWYGLSSIAARFINYLLTPYLTNADAIKTSDYGDMGLIYSALPILNVIFLYGFETAYFRFSSREEYKKSIYNTTAISIIFSTIVLTSLLWVNQVAFARIVGLQDVIQIIQISIFIIAFDALSAIPFAKLRQENRPRLFAFIKIGGILINVFFTWFFISYCPSQLKMNPNSWVGNFYDIALNPIVYVVLANLIQAIVTLLLLSKQIAAIRLNFNTKLWKEMMIYSLPLVIVGMGGMINETFDRLMLRWWFPAEDIVKKEQVGIYNACYKLSILITLFIQAFRMGAEPFFFKQSTEKEAPKTYAKVMKFFVITICLMFLVVTLEMPIWRNFIGTKYWAGLRVVPILLLANMFLGIYYNLSVWYKLGNKTMAGAWITIIGALVTICFNYIFIPHFSYMACAWATFFCYGSMMVISFTWGQKHYRIPYAWKKLIAYIVIVVLLFFIQKALLLITQNIIFELATGTLLIGLFIWFILLVEQKEFIKMPLIKRLYKTKN
ncbi:MAG: oligosaccharide flippase family protein [Bacteroidetes bacterium]|nr:oligosaccharide flippase family protein [Bacteroidota bacterium]